jgi:hypothetical protein
MAKMQELAANNDDRRANWIAANGDLAPARRDIDVGGVSIPAGTSFSEFNNNAVKRGNAGAVSPAIAAINNKYGGK